MAQSIRERHKAHGVRRKGKELKVARRKAKEKGVGREAKGLRRRAHSARSEGRGRVLTWDILAAA
jgi:hypothetical protein